MSNQLSNNQDVKLNALTNTVKNLKRRFINKAKKLMKNLQKEKNFEKIKLKIFLKHQQKKEEENVNESEMKEYNLANIYMTEIEKLEEKIDEHNRIKKNEEKKKLNEEKLAFKERVRRLKEETKEERNEVIRSLPKTYETLKRHLNISSRSGPIKINNVANVTQLINKISKLNHKSSTREKLMEKIEISEKIKKYLKNSDINEDNMNLSNVKKLLNHYKLGLEEVGNKGNYAIIKRELNENEA